MAREFANRRRQGGARRCARCAAEVGRQGGTRRSGEGVKRRREAGEVGVRRKWYAEGEVRGGAEKVARRSAEARGGESRGRREEARSEVGNERGRVRE